MPESRWPTAPLVEELERRMGVWDQDNTYGYTHANAAELLATKKYPLSGEVWGRRVRRGWINDEEADRFATRLGYNPSAFWPAFNDVALEQYDDVDDVDDAVAVVA